MLGLLLTISACSAKTSFEATQPNVTVKINQFSPVNTNDKQQHEYKTTSFGQYRFVVYQDNEPQMYGLMPLKFNGGYLAADILFFAPAMFFNLRETFPFYQFDIDQKVIRYKKKIDAPWITYEPTEAEINRAKQYYN